MGLDTARTLLQPQKSSLMGEKTQRKPLVQQQWEDTWKSSSDLAGVEGTPPFGVGLRRLSWLLRSESAANLGTFTGALAGAVSAPDGPAFAFLALVSSPPEKSACDPASCSTESAWCWLLMKVLAAQYSVELY